MKKNKTQYAAMQQKQRENQMINLGKNSNGIPFNARVVREGDKYGLNDCRVHNDNDPLIEFYDARYNHSKYGQFVSRYYASTLTGKCEWSSGRDSRKTGLNLDCSISDWFVDANQVTKAIEAINT